MAPSVVWVMDFMRDTLMNGPVFRTLNLIDEFNCGARAMEINLSSRPSVLSAYWTSQRHGSRCQ